MSENSKKCPGKGRKSDNSNFEEEPPFMSHERLRRSSEL